MKTKFAAEASAKESSKNARFIASILLNLLAKKEYDAESFAALFDETVISKAPYGHYDILAPLVTEMVLSGAAFNKLKTPLSVISEVLTGNADTAVFEASEEKPVKTKGGGKKAVSLEEDEPVKTKKSAKTVNAVPYLKKKAAEEDTDTEEDEESGDLVNESGGKPGRPSKHLRAGFSKLWSEMTAQERKVFVKAFNIGDCGYSAFYSKKDGKVPKDFSAENARDDSGVTAITVSVGKTLRLAFFPTDTDNFPEDHLRLVVELPTIRCSRKSE